VSELGVGLLMGTDNIECEWEGTVIIIIVGRKGHIKKMKFIRRWVSEGLVTEKVGHNVLGSGKINRFWFIFLNNQPPAVGTIIRKGTFFRRK
jgi:hypothetical protein